MYVGARREQLIQVEELSAEAFAPYGWVLGKDLSLSKLAFSSAATDFWEEHLFDAGVGGETEVLWVNYRSTEKKVRNLEAHLLTQQIVVPLTGEIVQLVADGDLRSVRAFRIQQGQGICMRTGCWHTTRVTQGEVRCLMVTRLSTTKDLVGHLKGATPLTESALIDVDVELA